MILIWPCNNVIHLNLYMQNNYQDAGPLLIHSCLPEQQAAGLGVSLDEQAMYLFLASRLPVVFTTLPPLPSLSFTNLQDKGGEPSL